MREWRKSPASWMLVASLCLPAACVTDAVRESVEPQVADVAGSLEQALTAPLPAVDASRVMMGRSSYVRTVKFPSGPVDIHVTRTVSGLVQEPLLLEEVIDGVMGTGQVQMQLDADTLRPISGRAEQGPGIMEVSYSDQEVTGIISAIGEEESFHIELPAPAYAYGSALDVVLAALPLAEGYGTTLRFAEFGVNQRLRVFRLSVPGRETVEVPAGTFNCWRVELEAMDGLGMNQTVWITAEAPYHAVKITGTMPPAMNHAPYTTVLTARPVPGRSGDH